MKHGQIFGNLSDVCCCAKPLFKIAFPSVCMLQQTQRSTSSPTISCIRAGAVFTTELWLKFSLMRCVGSPDRDKHISPTAMRPRGAVGQSDVFRSRQHRNKGNCRERDVFAICRQSPEHLTWPPCLVSCRYPHHMLCSLLTTQPWK